MEDGREVLAIGVLLNSATDTPCVTSGKSIHFSTPPCVNTYLSHTGIVKPN